jgi:hypothetical protein
VRAFFLLLIPSLLAAQTFPISIHSSGRYLVDHDGKPFLMVQESAWSLGESATVDTAQRYLADRQDKGISTILVMLPVKQMANYPLNAVGQTIWSGTPYNSPNTSYFAHADSILTEALNRKFFVWIAAMYLGYDTSQGFKDQINARSAAEMKTYGQWLGNRYKSYPNLGWMVGGDIAPETYQTKIDSFISGLRSTDTNYFRLFTTHNNGGTFSTTGDTNVFATSHGWRNRSWLNFNGLYDYATAVYVDISTGYDMTPVRPVHLFDGMYEQASVNYSGGTTDMLVVRKQLYWPVLRGGVGIHHGNDPLWGFGFNFRATPGGPTNGGDWYSQLNSPGSVFMSYAAKLWRSRYWWKLVPNRDSTVMTAGSLTGDNYATTAVASDSSSIISYIPTQRSVTINPAKLSGDSLHLYWFDPQTASVTDAGMYSKASRSYTPPTAQDWVMVMDSKNFRNVFTLPGEGEPRTFRQAILTRR